VSTSETVTFDANVCPCGRGKILKHVTTQDNPWSTDDISYELSCPVCATDWQLESTGVALISRHASAETSAANVRWMEAEKPLHSIVEGLVGRYFAQFAAKSKKAEWQKMQRLDIYMGSYRNFLHDKLNNKPAGKIAYGLRNREWLTGLAKQSGQEGELQRLMATWDASRREWEQAARSVKRWPVDAPRR